MAEDEVAAADWSPLLQPTAFEQQLLAQKPLTYALYQQALQASASCIEREIPGATVTYSQNPLYSYLEGFQIAFSGASANPTGPGSNKNDETIARCDSQYSAQVEANWTFQNQLSGSSLVAQQAPFLRCVIAAGVHISSSATLDQIHQYFTNPDWGNGLSAAQSQAANTCVTNYATFLDSL